MKFDLAVTVRDKTGKGTARQLRRDGKVPGVLYGQGECLLLTIEPDPLIKILKSQAGSTALITLTVNGAKSKPKRTALLRDFQVDPVEGNVLHADLFEISMDKPIRVKVPVHVIGGTPAGVKEGGILHYNTRQLHVECLPAALPDHIEVDASPLAIGQGIHLKEIAKIEGVRYLDDLEQMVVSVAVPMSDAKLEALLTSQAVGPEGAKEPEVEAKGKAAAEGVEGAPAAPGAAAPAAAGAEAKPGEKKEGAAAAAAPKAEKKEPEKKK
jgi:large subunit ribosomal protein L25